MAQTAQAASIWSHRTAQTGSSTVLETTADLLLRSSPPTLKTTTATCQTGKSLSQPSFICKKNPLTVCAARYRTNYGGNGGMNAKAPAKPLKNSQSSTNECVKEQNVKEARRTAQVSNDKGVAPKVSMLWHFSLCPRMQLYAPSCCESVHPFRSTHATPRGPKVKEEAKIWTFKVQCFIKGLTVKPINVKN